MASTFTDQEVRILITLERVGGIFSLVAVCLIFLAYALSAKYRTIPNTFIVFASIANVGASTGSVIAYNGIWQGESSILCQAQGFLFEMFMQSDPWWSFAMAFNVLLVFQFRVSPVAICRLWWAYCGVCYGGPFIIALVLLLIRNDSRGLIYGDAGIWCWVDKEWNPVRVYSYYMFIWFCILGSFVIYGHVGGIVFRSRNRVNNFVSPPGWDFVDRGVPNMPLHDAAPAYGTATTEVHITTGPTSTATHLSPPRRPGETYDPRFRMESHTQVYPSYTTVTSPRTQTSLKANDTLLRQLERRMKAVGNKFAVSDPVKRAYLLTSFLFALSVLATWIPSSINRIHGLIYPGDSPFGYSVVSAAVLPLQGVWNCLIFFFTSWPVFRAHRRVLWKKWKDALTRALAGQPSLSGSTTPGDEESGSQGKRLSDGGSLELLNFLNSDPPAR